MVGRKLFGQVDRRLRQVFPHRTKQNFGGCSCISIGDWGQLPPVMDLPLYTTGTVSRSVSRLQISDLGSANYYMFDRTVVLDQVMRQAGEDSDRACYYEVSGRIG
jgi:ATP-dependent DNA helicase PIF1